MSLDPPVWSALELDVFRGGFVVASLWSFDALHRTVRRDRLSHPTGWARVVPLRFADHAAVRRVVPTLVWLSVVAYLLDRQLPVALFVLATVLVVEITRDNSGGGGGHAHHLVATVTMAQLAAVIAWAWADATGRGPSDLLLDSRSATMAWWSVQAIVGVYFLSGLEKLFSTGGLWLQRAPGLLVRALSVQTSAMMQGGGRRRAAARRAESVTLRLVRHPWIARCLFGGGLAVELLAPIGLLDHRLLVAVGVSILALHLANGQLLVLAFARWQLLVLIYLVNVPQLFG